MVSVWLFTSSCLCRHPLLAPPVTGRAMLRVLSRARELLPRHRSTAVMARSSLSGTRLLSGASKETDSFLSGSNAVYAEEMHRAWLKDPSSVHASWQAYFKGVAAGGHPGAVFTPAPAPGSPLPSSTPSSTSNLQTRVMQVLRAYQVRGHERAQLDPLRLWDPLRFGGECRRSPLHSLNVNR